MRTAPTQVWRQRMLQGLFVKDATLTLQPDERHDYPGRAISALRRRVALERVDDIIRITCGNHAFQRLYPRVFKVTCGCRATRASGVVDEDSACTTLLGTTSKLGCRETKVVAQNEQQRRVVQLYADLLLSVVDVELDVYHEKTLIFSI